MKIKKTFVRGVAIVMALLMTGLAQANDEKCIDPMVDGGGHLKAVEDAILRATFTSGRKSTVNVDQANLLSKKEAAWSKVLEGSYGDAVGKLDDIVTKVSDLLNAPKEKIDTTGGENILVATDDAIRCVIDLQMASY
jgi:hypothetical protein